METLRKGSNEYIISRINSTISALVYDKVQMRKAYNYYNGILDRDQYKHIEETYGISCPTNIEFIPLTKKHIDALVGELQGQPINRKISCKDSATLSNIFRDKQKYVLDNVRKKYMQDLYYKVYKTFVDSNIIPPRDLISEKYIEELSSDLDKNYISEYEMAAQNIITWVIQSRDINLINKVIALFRDLLITGTCYYRMLPSINKTNINLEVLSPLDTFVEKNPNSNYLKDCSRCCIRYYLTKDQILSKYGSELSASDKDKLMNGSGTSSESYSSDNTYIVRSNYPVGASEDPANESTGILGGLEVCPNNYNPRTYAGSNYLTVYEVEFIETDKDGVEHRYSGVKIEGDIYIIREKDLYVSRSRDNKNKCQLSVNGMFFSIRQDQPFSLILATATLQDKYNLMYFYRDNLIATSGTKGDWIDVSMIPEWMGATPEERLIKWISYKKGMGVAPFNSVSEDNDRPPLNTTFGGFDDTVSANSIQAIQLAIESIEQTVSNITGVSREKLNAIEQKDAVNNVKVGIEQSTIITKHYFASINSVIQEIFVDALNLAKQVYPNGISGEIILGNRLHSIFTADPKYYTTTDFDVHILDGQNAVKNLETVKQLTIEMIKAQMVDVETAIEVATGDSLTEIKQRIIESNKKLKEETSSIQQLQQQAQQLQQANQEAQQQIQQLQQELQKAQQQLQSSNSEQEKLKLEWYKAQSENKFKEQKVKNEDRKIDVELAQMFDNNPNNNELNYSK